MIRDKIETEKYTPVISKKPVRIYALIDPFTGLVRYIGKTEYTLAQRMTRHINDAKKQKRRQHCCRWIKKLLLNGAKPICREIQIVPAGKDWGGAERRWIRRFRAKGCNLTNHSEGGWGGSGFVRTKSHREAIAAALRKGNTFPCRFCGKPTYRQSYVTLQFSSTYCSKKCYQASQRGISRLVPECVRIAGSAKAAIIRRAMTTCKRGHSLTGDGVYINPRGGRVCKECRRIHKREFARRRRHASI